MDEDNCLDRGADWWKLAESSAELARADQIGMLPRMPVPEQVLWDIIQRVVLVRTRATDWTGTLTELEALLHVGATPGEIPQIPVPSWIGYRLECIGKFRPAHVWQRKTPSGRLWTIRRSY